MLALNAENKRRRQSGQRPRLQCFDGDAAGRSAGTREVDEEYISPTSLSGHVAVASDRTNNQTVGLVRASRRALADGHFLLVEQIDIDAAWRPAATLRRLISMILLRVAGFDRPPSALAITTADDWTARSFLSLARHFAGSVSYPSYDGATIALASARTAKQIARSVAPHLRYDIANSILRGMRLAAHSSNEMRDMYGANTAISLKALDVATSCDELLLVIDFQSIGDVAVIDAARKAYRKL